MRVAFLTHYPELYGANRSLLDLIDGLRSYEVDARVIIPREGPIMGELRKRGIPFRICRLGRWVTSPPDNYRAGNILVRGYQRLRFAGAHLKSNIRAFPQVVSRLRKWDPNIVYSNSSTLLSGALAARYLGVPHIWHIREFGDLDYGFLPDLGHGIQRWLIRRADGVIAVSDSIRAYYDGTAASRVQVVNSGVLWASEFDRLRKEVNSERATSDYTFALIGVLHPAKGQETAIRAIHKVVRAGKRVRLALAGAGPASYRRELEGLVGCLGLESVVDFHGYTSDPYSVYLNADAALMCSRNEAMGRVTAEAMAVCRPVIGFRSSGTEEIIEHEKTGLLYEGGMEELAAAMVRLIDNPAWARELGNNGWKSARERFTIERYAAGVFEVLSRVVAQTGMPTGSIRRSEEGVPGFKPAANG